MDKLLSLPAIGAVVILLSRAHAQTLEDVRDQLREDVRESGFGAALIGLINLTNELELGGANFSVDDANNTKIKVLALPAVATFHPWGDSGSGLYVEGVFGYVTLSSDRFSVLEETEYFTSADWTWTTYGGLGGVGVELEVAEGLSVTPIMNLAISRIENDATYEGPGADLAATVLDEIALNWNATLMTLGGALRVDWIYPLENDVTLETIARIDYRWSTALQSTDAAQDVSTDSQLLTLRADLVGPTGWLPFGWPANWRAIGGYRRYGNETGQALGFYDFYEVGGSIELDSGDALPLIGGVKLTTTLIFGRDVSGWSISAGASF